MPAMSERIERLFVRCRDEKRAAFIPYICAGDPKFARTVGIAVALEEALIDKGGERAFGHARDLVHRQPVRSVNSIDLPAGSV